MSKSIEICLTEPPGFVPSLEVAALFCEHEGKILMVKRHGSKTEGLLWGVPAGKVEPGEQIIQAAVRELSEETAIQTSPDQLTYMGALYISRPSMRYPFHMFFLHLQTLPTIKLALDENTEARWVSYEEGMRLPLMAAGKEALTYFSHWSSSN